MSSPDRLARPSRRILGAALLGGALLALAGCTDGIRPLYGSTAGGVTVDALRHVDVRAGGRMGQIVRNELAFAFWSGTGEPDRPIRWILDVQLTYIDTSVGIDRYSNIATAQIGQMSAHYTLTDASNNRTLTTGTAFANAPFDNTQNRFANQRAKRDAENRSAAAVAADIRTKIAVWFAANPQN